MPEDFLKFITGMHQEYEERGCAKTSEGARESADREIGKILGPGMGEVIYVNEDGQEEERTTTRCPTL